MTASELWLCCAGLGCSAWRAAAVSCWLGGWLLMLLARCQAFTDIPLGEERRGNALMFYFSFPRHLQLFSARLVGEAHLSSCCATAVCQVAALHQLLRADSPLCHLLVLCHLLEGSHLIHACDGMGCSVRCMRGCRCVMFFCLDV